VKSTFPFRAFEYRHKSADPRQTGKCIQFMDIQATIASIFCDSDKGTLMRQLVSSPCFIETDGFSCTRDTTCNGCINEESPPTPTPAEAMKSTKPGVLDTKIDPGCKFECKNLDEPESNDHSFKLIHQVSITKWDCAYGNTLNTFHVLGHSELLKSTPFHLSHQHTTFQSVVDILSNKLRYSTAVSTSMSKDSSLNFEELDKCINSANVPALILFNIDYSSGISRRHLIGIVPTLMIEDKFEMHIVDGCHSQQKSVPLTRNNLDWCCSGSSSYFVERFVLFAPGKNCRKKLTSAHQIYNSIKTNQELMSFIPSKCRGSKKRKREF